MFKRKRVLIEWSGSSLGVTIGKKYLIDLFGYFYDNQDNLRSAAHGVWVKPERKKSNA